MMRCPPTTRGRLRCGCCRRPSYLLITRQGPEPRPISSHYLQRALVPNNGRGGEKVTRITASQIDRESIAGPDLLVLDHPGKIEGPTISLLASALRRGKPIFYVACEPADANNLKLLADAAGTDLRLPVEFKPGPRGAIESSTGRAAEERSDLCDFWRAVAGDRGHLPFCHAADLRSQQGRPRRRHHRQLRRPHRLPGRHRLCRRYAGDPERRSGQLEPVDHRRVCGDGGRAEQSLAQQTVEPPRPRSWASPGRWPWAAMSGRSTSFRFSARTTRRQPTRGSCSTSRGVAVWRWALAPPAGAYRVMRGNTMIAALATAVPAEESDLSPMDPALIQFNPAWRAGAIFILWTPNRPRPMKTTRGSG